MNKIISLLCAIGLTLFTSLASAGHLTGTLQYVHNWSGCTNTANALNTCTQTGTTRALADVFVEVLNSSNTVVATSKTSGSGLWQTTTNLPAGTYSIRVSWRDGTTGNASSFGDAGVVLVNQQALPTGVLTDTFATGVVLTAPAANVVTRNFTINASASQAMRDRAQAFTATNAMENRWESSYANAFHFTGAGSSFRARLFNVTATASGGIQCVGSSSDCAYTLRVSFNQSGPTTIWHELGHNMQQYAQLVFSGFTWKTSPHAAGACQGTTESASLALQEGWADFVAIATNFTQANMPNNPTGAVCNVCAVSPSSPQPTPPACGPGAFIRTRAYVAKGFVELADANSVPADGSCVNETISINPGTLMESLGKYTSSNCGSGSCVLQCGTEEGGTAESVGGGCAVSSPNWPYIGSNALPTADQMSFLDLLGFLKRDFGQNGTQLRNVWANTCWQPGDSAIQLP